jgi:hypothetical protein
MEHKLQSGTTMSQKFARLGVAKSKMFAGPRAMFAMVSGPPASGKTNFFIINLDQASMPARTEDDIKAGVWPGVDEDGQCVDVDGSSFTMTWEKVQEKVEVLKELAQNKQDRPEMVVFDTLSGMLQLATEYVTRKGGKKDFKELDGRRAYDDLYSLILNTCNDLRRHGYGVWLICHIVNKSVQLGEDRYEERPRLTITGGFWQRLFWQLELSGVITAEWDVETYEREVKTGRVDSQGNEIIRKRPETRKVKKHTFTINHQDYLGITKGKVSFSDLHLTRESAWEQFESAYTGTSHNDEQ